MNEQNGIEKELNNLNKKTLELTEGVLEHRYHILNNAEQNLISTHIEQIRNIGIISGIVAPFSLTLLQLESIVVNVHFLLFGFSVLIINMILSQIILHIELTKKNKNITDASVSLNFATSSREHLESELSMLNEEINPANFFIQNIAKVDKALGISQNNVESLMTKIRFRKYDKFVVYTFALGCFLIILSLFFDSIVNLVNLAFLFLISYS